jgi:LemA protein
MAFEQQALESLMAARSEANRVRENAHQQPDNAGAVEEWLGAERDLGSALGRLWIALENYPELKARQSVADLTEQLTSTENRIAFARQAHNDWVTTFNAYRQAFPQCMVATLLGFSRDRKWLDASNPDKPATVWSTAILTPVERG